MKARALYRTNFDLCCYLQWTGYSRRSCANYRWILYLYYLGTAFQKIMEAACDRDTLIWSKMKVDAGSHTYNFSIKERSTNTDLYDRSCILLALPAEKFQKQMFDLISTLPQKNGYRRFSREADQVRSCRSWRKLVSRNDPHRSVCLRYDEITSYW